MRADEEMKWEGLLFVRAVEEIKCEGQMFFLC